LNASAWVDEGTDAPAESPRRFVLLAPGPRAVASGAKPLHMSHPGAIPHAEITEGEIEKIFAILLDCV
jgi:hypothetical protein